MAMKNKALIVGVLVLFLLGGAVFAFVKIRQGTVDEKAVDSVGQNIDNGSSLGEKDRADNYLTWNDPGGFSFAYPESWLFDPHEQDVVNYTNLDITKRGNTGGITILATDSKYKIILDWTKKDKAVIGSSFMETTLGGVNAQKALLKSGGVVVGMIDEGVIYTLELKPDETGYWEGEYNKVLSSFKLVYPTNYPKANTSGSTSTGGTSGDIIEEEEEVID